MLCWFRLFCIAATLVTCNPTRADEPDSHAPQTQVPKLLNIRWELGPNLPQGFQDSDGGFIGDTLITACGFCSGGLEEDNRRKPGAYPRGFLKKVWGLNLAKQDPRWEPLPDFPGEARQGVFSAIVADRMYIWGGFSYTEPYCYDDGFVLSRDHAESNSGDWKWEPLPRLPWKITSAAMAVLGERIYLLGGADYDGVRGFYTEADRVGDHKRMGAALFVLDTQNLNAGWKALPECPGTPRFVHTLQQVEGKLYAIGGATGDLVKDGMNYGYCSVVDNWRFDPVTDQWQRLRDTPVSTGNFPKSSNLVYRNRYILLPGGHQYTYIVNPDGSTRTKYGKASQKRPESGLHNDLYVFDTQTNAFATGDLLPIDNNLPMTVIRGDRIYMLGGETGGGEVLNQYFGHHPDLLLIGQISLMNK